MSTAEPSTYSTPRRSRRIWFTAPVLVSFTFSERLQWTEETSTIVVNAHGALILLGREVAVGQVLTLADVKTNERRRCRVAMIGDSTGEMTEVGVELLEPYGDFWSVPDPPGDWAPFKSPRPPEVPDLASRTKA